MTTPDPIVTCGVRVYRCSCVKEVGHADPVHACDAGCGGSWTGESEATMRPVTMPSGVPNSGLPTSVVDRFVVAPTMAELGGVWDWTDDGDDE